MAKENLTIHGVALKDIERLEFFGLREANGTVTAFNDQNFPKWPDVLVIEGVEFKLEEFDDDDHYTPENATSDQTGSLAWYVPSNL